MGVPLVDLSGWFDGIARAEVAARVDAALREYGFLLITGHGVPDELRDGTRALCREFFALPDGEKQPYAVNTGGRGWMPPGEQATGRSEGGVAPPDLKETFAFGSDDPAGGDPFFFRPNVYPTAALRESDRWRSTRHRVLPPDATAPDEDLVSLIFFYNTDPDARIVSLDGRYPEVVGGEYLRAKLAAISLE